MNKKGFGGTVNFALGLVGMWILVIVIAILVPIEEGLKTKEEAIKELDYSNFNSTFRINESNNVITNVVFKFLDAIVYSSLEVAKLGVSLGADNLHIKPTTVVLIILLSLISPILLSLIKISLITIIFVRDLLASRKEKKELNNLRKRRKKG